MNNCWFQLPLNTRPALLSGSMFYVRIIESTTRLISHKPELRYWTLWTCAPSAHPETVFHQPSRCSLRLSVHFRVDNFLLNGQNVMCTCWFRSAIWLVQPEQGAGSRQLFPRMLPGSLLPPFLRREPGDKASRIWLADVPTISPGLPYHKPLSFTHHTYLAPSNLLKPSKQLQSLSFYHNNS